MSVHLVLGRASVALRRLIARHHLIRWIPIVVCCGGLLVAVQSYVRAADAARSEWSDIRSVWVAVGDHAPGDLISAEPVDLPAVAVPDHAADAIAAGATARQRLGDGEVVTDADLAGDGPLALVPSDHRAVAVRESVASGADVGERVDVVAEGVVIAAAALVVSVRDEAVLVAVTRGEAPLVAHASEAGVTLLRMVP